MQWWVGHSKDVYPLIMEDHVRRTGIRIRRATLFLNISCLQSIYILKRLKAFLHIVGNDIEQLLNTGSKRVSKLWATVSNTFCKFCAIVLQLLKKTVCNVVFLFCLLCLLRTF